jgi:thiol-disulfide isomerase/thioredoxin
MIAVLAVLARIVLAVVLGLAGTMKLIDRAGTRTALRDFGVPRALVPAAAIALPLAELVVAVLLMPASTAVIGAAAALTLLLAFTAVLATTVARGRAPACHCFGQLHSAPASWSTVTRNLVLSGVAAFGLAGALVAPDASALAWVGDARPVELALAVAACTVVGLAAGGTFALFTLLRSYGRVLVRLERLEAAMGAAGFELERARPGLEPGTQAPWFLAPATSGTGVSRDELLAPELPVLLLFTSPHCGPCTEILPDAARWQEELAGRLTVAFASAGTPDAVGAEAIEFGLERVLVDEDGSLARSFEAPGTPAAVLIAPDGTVASRVAVGREEIHSLVDGAGLTGEHELGLPVGTDAPAVVLPALDGSPVSFESFRGRETMLLFWNPACGFCRSLRDDVRALEERADETGLRLIVVSSGDREATRAEAFTSAVVLDPDNTAGPAFGAGGTPMAVLVDAEGRIASPVVAGGEAVLELAGGPGAALVAR